MENQPERETFLIFSLLVSDSDLRMATNVDVSFIGHPDVIIASYNHRYTFKVDPKTKKSIRIPLSHSYVLQEAKIALLEGLRLLFEGELAHKTHTHDVNIT